MGRECFPFDSIPLAFPLGFNLCGIHALFSISMKVCDPDPLYHTLCTDAIQSMLHQTHHHLGAGVGFGISVEFLEDTTKEGESVTILL
jgi:hypothetical protein